MHADSSDSRPALSERSETRRQSAVATASAKFANSNDLPAQDMAEPPSAITPSLHHSTTPSSSAPPLPWFADRFPLFLAPMAGVSDKVFRQLCKEQGADVLTTEFVSSEGI